MFIFGAFVDLHSVERFENGMGVIGLCVDCIELHRADVGRSNVVSWSALYAYHVTLCDFLCWESSR